MKDTERRRLNIHGLYAVVSLLSLMYMIYHAEDVGFWYDEFAQICYSGLGKTVTESLLIPDPTPPFFTVAANVWYNLVPYGERWLLLLPQIATAAAVYVTALWGERLFEYKTGLFAGILLGFSQMVIEQCGFEFRSYGFYLLFSALSLYMHTLLQSEAYSAKRIVCYGLALAGLSYSHLFGVLICIVLGGIDLFLVLCRRVCPTILCAYAMAGTAFLPWGIYFLRCAGGDALSNAAGWMAAPSLWEVAKLAAYLCGNNLVACLLLVIGTAYIIKESVRSIRDCRWTIHDMLCIVPIIVCSCVTVVIYFYGIMRAGYATLWVKRYFTGLFPPCAIICSYGGNCFCRWGQSKIVNEQKQKLAIVGVYGILAASIISITVYRIAATDTPHTIYYHREAAQMLCEQPDIAQEDVIVLSTLGDYTAGWEVYYGEKCGNCQGFQAASAYSITENDLNGYHVVYLEYGYPKVEAELWEILENEYILERVWGDISVNRYVKR